MASVAFPLNRNDQAMQTRKGGEKPEALKLVDLGSPTMFGVLQDNRHFYVKQILRKKGTDCEVLEMAHISHCDFGSITHPMQSYLPKSAAAIAQLVPLNRKDSVLVNLAASQRYLIYNYSTGQITKEVLHLRGKSFKICSDWQFDLEKAPYVTMYNSGSIRRVDINTFEIKKTIDLSRIAAKAEVPRFPAVATRPSYGWQYQQGYSTNGFKYPVKAGQQANKYAKYPVKPTKEGECDTDIQEVILMPMMKVDQAAPAKPEEQTPKPKTKFILQQLGQITIAIPQVCDGEETGPEEKEAAKDMEKEKPKSMYACDKMDNKE